MQIKKRGKSSSCSTDSRNAWYQWFVCSFSFPQTSQRNVQTTAMLELYAHPARSEPWEWYQRIYQPGPSPRRRRTGNGKACKIVKATPEQQSGLRGSTLCLWHGPVSNPILSDPNGKRNKHGQLLKERRPCQFLGLGSHSARSTLETCGITSEIFGSSAPQSFRLSLTPRRVILMVPKPKMVIEQFTAAGTKGRPETWIVKA